MPLDVPEAECAVTRLLAQLRDRGDGDEPQCGSARLREAEVGIVEERELELLVLADGHERAGRVQALQS